MEARYLPVGDRAVTVEFDKDINPEANLYVQGMDLTLQKSPIQGVVEVVPTVRSLLVYYDPEKLTFEEVKERLKKRESQMAQVTLPPKKLVRIPCCYGGEYGPDLDYVASTNGLHPSELMRIHSNTRYQVYCFGSAPGFPNMGITSPKIATPRRPTPRMMPPGTVAIGGKQSVIYIVENNGGLWMLGRTPLKLYNPLQPLKRMFDLGDSVQFYPINATEFKEIESKQSESEKEKKGSSTPSEEQRSPTLELIHPGFFTTVQDLGRYGYQKYGVAVTGAMDDLSLRVSNLLVGNDEGEAALEITLLGPQMRVLNDTLVAVMGGDLNFKVNGQAVKIGKTIPIKKGDILSFGPPRSGCRAYLSVAGGIDVPQILGSRSTYPRGRFGGVDGRLLQAGDILFVRKSSSASRPIEITNLDALFPQHDKNDPIRVILGPQDDYFTKESVDIFLTSKYTVTNQSDRVGYSLEGPQMTHRGDLDIISDGVAPGSIQILTSGKPTIMFKDRQAGGYPKIGVVITTDLNRLAQLKPGDSIRFKAISLEEAHTLFKECTKKITSLRGPEK